jgi:hypothetical protein
MICFTLSPGSASRNRFRRPPGWLGVAGVCLGLTAGLALADIQQEKPGRREDKEKNTRQDAIRRAADIPTPQDASVTVLRGVPTRIRLNSTAALRQAVVFRLGDRPAHGTVSDPRPTAENPSSAVVTYTAGPGSAATDSFTFRVKHRDTATSGSATVSIRIVDPQPELVVPGTLDFGEAVIGETAVRPLTLENKGTAAFAAALRLDPPWRLLQESTEVRLEPGARIELRVGFAPATPGDAAFTLAFPGLDRTATRLTGRAVAPVLLQPSLVPLEWEPSARTRRATVTLTNRLDAPLEYTLAGSPRLTFSEERGTLPPRGSAEVAVSLPLPDADDLQSLLSVSARGTRVEVPLTAAPAPPVLTLAGSDGWQRDGDTLSLPEGAAEGALVFANEGGESAALTVTLPPGWGSPGLENAAPLGPRETRRLLLVPPSDRATDAIGPLELRLQEERVALTLSAPAPAAPAPVAASLGPDALLTAVPSVLTEGTGQRELTAEEKQLQFMIDTLGVFPHDTRFDRNLPELATVSVGSMKPERVELALPSPGAEYSIMVFRDEYRPPPGSSRPTRHWLPVDGLKWKASGTAVTTTLSGLRPGGRVLLRFAVRTPDGRVGPASNPIAITTPVPAPRRWPWILGGAGLVAFGWWWRRRREGY